MEVDLPVAAPGLRGRLTRRVSIRRSTRTHQDAELTALKSSYAASLAEEISEQQRSEGDLEKAHESNLVDPGFLSGDTVKAHHQIEWNRRTQHNPQFAKSPMETTLLKMEQLGKDPSIAAVDALREVALLAAPKGSRGEGERLTGRQRVLDAQLNTLQAHLTSTNGFLKAMHQTWGQ